MKSTRYLMKEHKLILRALEVLDAIVVRVEENAGVDPTDVDAILNFLRWFGDAHHQEKEEKVLFPALKDAAAGEQTRPLQHMILEHNQERSLIEHMEKAARLRKSAEFTQCAGRLAAAMRNHIYKEDEILFESACSILSRADDEKVLQQLEAFETIADQTTLQAMLQDLRRMEWTYLRKTGLPKKSDSKA